MNKDKINGLILNVIENSMYSLKAIIINNDLRIFKALDVNTTLGLILNDILIPKLLF